MHRSTTTLAVLLAAICLAQIGCAAAQSPRDWYHRFLICRNQFDMGGDVRNITKINYNASNVGSSYYLTLEQGVNGGNNATARDHNHLYAAQFYGQCVVTARTVNDTVSFCTGDFVYVNNTGTISIQGMMRTQGMAETNMSITGGTKAYKGASGYMRVQNASPINAILFYVHLDKQPNCKKVYDPYFD